MLALKTVAFVRCYFRVDGKRIDLKSSCQCRCLLLRLWMWVLKLFYRQICVVRAPSRTLEVSSFNIDYTDLH